MKFGVVIGICTDLGQEQRSAVNSFRRFSRPDTNVIALFNGTEPFPLDEGIEVMHVKHRIGRDQGVWGMGLQLGVERGWEWFCTAHDDFWLLESGWEAQVEALCKVYKVGVAGWALYDYLNAGRPPGGDFTFQTGNNLPADAPLGVAADGCGIAFNVALFRQRGFITSVQAQSGFGEMEANLWVYRNPGWCCARIATATHHHPGTMRNTREVLRIPTEGINESLEPYVDLIPAQVIDDHHIRFRERVVEV